MWTRVYEYLADVCNRVEGYEECGYRYMFEVIEVCADMGRYTVAHAIDMQR